MFKKKRVTVTKSNDSDAASHLGSKDNFLAVTSKHIAPSIIGQQPARTNSSHLPRHFQLLKMTDGFDLVLGDNTPGDGDRAHKASDTVSKGGTTKGGDVDGSEISYLYRAENRKGGVLYDVSHAIHDRGNISTIQIRKPGLKGQEWDIGSKAAAVESEVTAGKHTLTEESSTVVCEINSSNLIDNTITSANSFIDNQGSTYSFQSGLRKFSSKGAVAPPPVAKKPARTGSGKTLPGSPVDAVPAQSAADEVNLTTASLRNSVYICNVSHEPVNSDIINSKTLNRSYSVEEGLKSTDARRISKHSNQVLPPLAQFTDLKFSSSHPNLIRDSDSNQGEFDFRKTTPLPNIPLSASTKSLPENDKNVPIATNVPVFKETVDSRAEMSYYRFPKVPDSSSKRNSVGDLIEGIGSGFVGIHRRIDDCNAVKETGDFQAPENISPPEVPRRRPMPVYNEPGSSPGYINDTFNDKSVDCQIFVSGASTETNTVECDGEESFTSGPEITDVSQLDQSPSDLKQTETHSKEISSKSRKRLSSTPNYENWTINRAITVSSRDFFSASDDDELDDIPSSPNAASPYIDHQDFSKGSKDSGLCDDIGASEVSHTDVHRSSVFLSDKEVTSQVEHCLDNDDEDQAFHGSICLDTDRSHEGDSEAVIAADPDLSPQKRHEDTIESLSVDRLSVDTLSVASDGDDDGSTNMDSSYDETDSAREGMLKMRQLLLKGVLDSEKGYLGILSLLIDYKRSLEASSMSSQPVISKEDIQTIFSNIETVNEIHSEFVKSLEAKVMNWTHGERIGDIFKIMISKLTNFGNYLNNYQQAVSTIHRCCQESEQFANLAKHITVNSTLKEVTSLEDALFKPVQRVQRNTLVLHDLIRYTPTDHPDYPALQKALKVSQQIIENFATLIPQSTNTQENRRLVKSSFLVESVGGARKLRYIFLFNDVLVCTKRETHRNNKVSFDIKWFAPLSNTAIDTKVSYTDDNKNSKKDDINELKAKLKALKRELKTEMRKSDDRDKHRTLVSLGGGVARNVEKLKKKVNQTEAQLILASPTLPFKVLIERGKSYTLLMSTDYEREEWRETIASLCKKFPKTDQAAQAMSSIYIQELVNSVKETPQVNKIGNVLLQKDEDILTGILNVTIHKVNGLTEVCDTYCNMEMDSFGHFFFKAYTTICEDTQDPAWNEDFDLELEGSETLRILCFKKEKGGQGDTLLGRVALELKKNWLKDSFQETTLSANDISLVISVKHIPADKTMQRTPSRTSSAVFGVSISTCARREGKTMPTIVTACVQEVEKRGLDEVGVYRVSGVSSDLQSIKRLMDKNVRAGTSILQDADIHSVTGILKLYLRELPEPLFTEASYKSFIDTLKLSDEEAKTQCMLTLLHGLPDTNYYTVVYLLEHLVKVAKNVGVNRMSIHNLSTIFGPTLLAPASKQTSSDPLEMMYKGAAEVMQQSSVINFLLGLAFSGKSLRRSAQ
ncbi:hypothetical protein BsWGS_07628 [Bradybaena similaris]